MSSVGSGCEEVSSSVVTVQEYQADWNRASFQVYQNFTVTLPTTKNNKKQTNLLTVFWGESVVVFFGEPSIVSLAVNSRFVCGGRQFLLFL